MYYNIYTLIVNCIRVNGNSKKWSDHFFPDYFFPKKVLSAYLQVLLIPNISLFGF